MVRSRVQEVRRLQKKSFYLRELSSFLIRISQDEPLLAYLFITRVELSSDGGRCNVYFSVYNTNSIEQKQEAFGKAREVLVLYKASMRKALADALRARYVPELRFLYDLQKDKEIRIESLLEKVSEELSDSPELAEDLHKK